MCTKSFSASFSSVPPKNIVRLNALLPTIQRLPSCSANTMELILGEGEPALLLYSSRKSNRPSFNKFSRARSAFFWMVSSALFSPACRMGWAFFV
jgi:hypothetical protein